MHLDRIKIVNWVKCFTCSKIHPTYFHRVKFIIGLFSRIFCFYPSISCSIIIGFNGCFFDFFDGFFARIFGVESDLGVQLDSMADLITSGIAPGALMYQLFLLSGIKTNDYILNLSSDIFFSGVICST